MWYVAFLFSTWFFVFLGVQNYYFLFVVQSVCVISGSKILIVRYSVFGFMIAVHDMWYVVVCGCGLFVIRVNYGVFFAFRVRKWVSFLVFRCLICTFASEV